MKHQDFLNYYGLENHLFGTVSKNYQMTKTVSAFDFFCIIIWKANRAKSKVANRLLNEAKGHKNLDSAVSALIKEISSQADMKNRLRVIMDEWGFRLPMASAILTVLYPDDFTIYDVRVCEVLGDFQDAQHKKPFDNLWTRYEEYVQKVKATVTENLSLRDKDRWLWGKSFARQLEGDIENNFVRNADDSGLET
jgi:hypothetical protein